MVFPGCAGSGRQVNGSVGTGSPNKFPLKSPTFSPAVGTTPVVATPRSSNLHSSEKRKKILFFQIGPPIFPPKLLYFNFPLGAPARFKKKLFAFNLSLLRNSNPEP